MQTSFSARSKALLGPPPLSIQSKQENTFQAGNILKSGALSRQTSPSSPKQSPTPSSEKRPVVNSPVTNPDTHTIILSMLPLVKTVVGRIAITLPPHVSQEDLLSAGLMGLMDAVRRYDASKGCSLKSYVAIRVRGAVLDELRNMDWAPRSVHRLSRDLRKIQEGLEQRLGREASESEIAGEMKISVEEFERLLESVRPACFISLQDSRSHHDQEDDLTQEECIADPKGEDPVQMTSTREHQDLMIECIKALNPTEQKVLALYYYEGLRLKEIAQVLKVTESRVSQIHTLAVQRLRSRVESIQINNQPLQ
jgi:RNA polymerase sigma factor FliA